MKSTISGILTGAVPTPKVAELIGFEYVEARDGQATVKLTTTSKHHNFVGRVHGGILCDIADAAMAVAYGSLLDEEVSFTTVEFKINFLRPVVETTLRAVARVIHGGKTLGLVECDVLDSDERLVARSSCTCMTLRAQ